MAVVSIRFVKPALAVDPAGSTGDAIAARIGRSLMTEAVAAGVTEIAAECGGVLTCGTCHVFVRPPHVGWLEPPSVDEEELLSYTATPRRVNSRLSCQLIVTLQMDGMIVDLPEAQY